MVKAIYKLNQKRTNAFMLSPAAFALAACGGGSESGNSSSTTTPTGNRTWAHPSLLGEYGGDINDISTSQSSFSSGNAIEGSEVLILDYRLSDNDNANEKVISWFRDNEKIENTGNTTYTLTQEDVGKIITAEVLFLDGLGQVTHLSHFTLSGLVTNTNDDPEGNIFITGSEEIGNTISVNTANLADEDGLGELNYQWFVGGTLVINATSEDFVVPSSAIGKKIGVEVGYTDGFGNQEVLSFTSNTNVSDTVYVPDDTYAYLDSYNPLSQAEMDGAIALTWRDDEDGGRSIFYSTFEENAGLNDLFKFSAIEGVSYYFSSSSFFDPFIIRVYDQYANTLAVSDDNSVYDSYGRDVIPSFEAPYSGDFYVNASWDQGDYITHRMVSLYISESDIIVTPDIV